MSASIELLRDVTRALRFLYDEQNDAPYETRRAQWREAMDKVEAILPKAEAACDEGLPTLSDICCIAPDITGGKSVSEFLDEIRHE